MHATNDYIMFNSGELADSLAIEHLSMFGRTFIPFFAQSGLGLLFMLTKSDNIEHILKLDHKRHTIIAWSLNDPIISNKFEIDAPTFERRIEAAYQVQQAGYPIRIRLDPIIPFDGWKPAYAETIAKIFERITLKMMTIGTLKFEDNFYKNRYSIFSTGDDLKSYVDQMEPMLPEMDIIGDDGKPKKSHGKYSFKEPDRIEIFKFIIAEIRKHSDTKISLCKETKEVWDAVGLTENLGHCVCQLV